MSKPTEEDPDRWRWWLFVGGGALVGYLTHHLFFWAMVGFGLMLAFSLGEWIADLPPRDHDKAGDVEGDVSEPVSLDKDAD